MNTACSPYQRHTLAVLLHESGQPFGTIGVPHLRMFADANVAPPELGTPIDAVVASVSRDDALKLIHAMSRNPQPQKPQSIWN